MAIKKVIVAHPGKQHVFQLVTALKEQGIMYRFITMVYDKEDSITSKLKHILRGTNQKKAASRKSAILDDHEVLLFDEFLGLFLIVVNKLRVSKKVSSYFSDRVHSRFAMKVAKYALANNVDAVVMYDSNVYGAFDYIKKYSPQTKCILDVTIAARPVMKDIYIRDMYLTMDKFLKKEQIFLWDEKKILNFRNEFLVSDYMLVGSEFVKNSIITITGQSEKIIKIPYGVDINQFRISKKDNLNGPLRLFFVGGINRRKGIHHLLEIVSRYRKDQLILSLAGDFDPKSDLYKKYKDTDNISFEGFVTRDVVSDYYANSHIFVLPSLAEGLALVGLEALASGLPLLCTENTGVNDLVIDGKNGFAVPASDSDAFMQKLDWFLFNRTKIEQMGLSARQSVKDYSWIDYHQRVKDFFSGV
jgi:glycosyltransferase involved in cell wall biosynthesis